MSNNPKQVPRLRYRAAIMGAGPAGLGRSYRVHYAPGYTTSF